MERPRGVRPAAAGSKGLRGNQGPRRLGASADVPFLKTVFFSPAITITDITGAVQRMWHVSMTYDISFKFFQLQHGISLDLSSQVPVFKVPLKFKSPDFGACVC